MAGETRSIWEHSYDRKGFIAIGAMTALAAACGGEDDDTSGGADTTPKKLGGTLFYYNWADYVNPKTYPAFTKATGVKVKKDFYASNEDMLAKLKAGGSGYDLIVPTGNPFVKIMADDGVLMELDRSKLPNVEANVDPKFQGLPFDPDDKWSTPKDWGTTGFVYRTDLVNEKPTAWKEFNFCYQPRINALETSYTYFGSPLKRDLLEGVLDKEVLADETVFPPPAQLEKLTVADPSPEGERIRNRIWTEFKAA